MEIVSLMFLLLLFVAIIGYFWYSEYGLAPLPTTWGPPSWRVLRNGWWGDSDVVIYDTDPYDQVWTRGEDRSTKWYEWRKMSEAIEDLARSNRELSAKINQPPQPPPPDAPPPPESDV